MKTTATVRLVAVLLLIAMPAHAGQLKDQALSTARSTVYEQTGDPSTAGRFTSKRSTFRTWSGLGLVGAGLALAFSGKKCRTTGSLGPGYADSSASVSVSVSASDLMPMQGGGGNCLIEFTLTARADIDGEELVYSELVQLARPEELVGEVILPFFSGPGVPQDVYTAFVESVVGSAAAVQHRSRGRLAVGFGVASVGVLLATVLSRVPVTVTRLDRSTIAVGAHWGW